MSKFFLAFVLSFLLITPAYAQVGVNLSANASSSGGTFRVNADGSFTAVEGKGTSTEQEGMTRNSLGAEIRTAADVLTDDDLDAFEENILITDQNVADADSSSKHVAVSYWHKGRFLGIFPVRVQSRTTAELGEEDTLTVTTEMPWWSFLVFGIGDVQGDVGVALQGDGQFTANVLAREDAHARARAIETITQAHAKVAAGR